MNKKKVFIGFIILVIAYIIGFISGCENKRTIPTDIPVDLRIPSTSEQIELEIKNSDMMIKAQKALLECGRTETRGMKVLDQAGVILDKCMERLKNCENYPAIITPSSPSIVSPPNNIIYTTTPINVETK